MCLLTETRALSAQGEKRALVGNLTMPVAVVEAQGVEPVRACFGKCLTTRSLWSNTFECKRLSTAFESTGVRLSPLESTRFVEK